jgi:hypothetical protein
MMMQYFWLCVPVLLLFLLLLVTTNSQQRFLDAKLFEPVAWHTEAVICWWIFPGAPASFLLPWSAHRSHAGQSADYPVSALAAQLGPAGHCQIAGHSSCQWPAST